MTAPELWMYSLDSEGHKTVGPFESRAEAAREARADGVDHIYRVKDWDPWHYLPDADDILETLRERLADAYEDGWDAVRPDGWAESTAEEELHQALRAWATRHLSVDTQYYDQVGVAEHVDLSAEAK